jgi:hypothetical protein
VADEPMTEHSSHHLTCVLCGCTKNAEFFDGWRSALSSPGMSGKVDADRPECDHCTDLATWQWQMEVIHGRISRSTRVPNGRK